MIKKFSRAEYESCKSRDLLLLECEYCHRDYYRQKKLITYILKRKINPNITTYKNLRFCNMKCRNSFFKNEIKINCSNCQKQLIKKASHVRKSKSGRQFCNSSCAASYNNTHKTTGNRRSKLEKWIEQKLDQLYPNLKVLYNDKQAINAELDIYIPSFKLAIEINGIFHYEPIYGDKKLKQIQNNDHRKHQACYENNIEILWIDASKLGYMKDKYAQPYLDIIVEHINMKLLTS